MKFHPPASQDDFIDNDASCLGNSSDKGKNKPSLVLFFPRKQDIWF